MSDEEVPVGETVLTSGGDQIFPKGLPVGTVGKVSNGKDLFLNIRIKPGADLSKLEEVLVLVEKQDRQAVAEENVRVRASDILAQRLPSVPDKPPADANVAVPGAPGATKPPSATNAGTKPVGAQRPQVAKDQSSTSTQRVPGATPPVAGSGPNTNQKLPSSIPVKPATNPKPSVLQAKPVDDPALKPAPPNSAPPPSQPQQPTPPASENNPQ